MKPPRFVFYKPRVWSFRVWVLITEAVWVAFVNVIALVVYILWTVAWLLWMLLMCLAFALVILPYRLVKNHRTVRSSKLDAAQARMQNYQDDKE